MKTSNFAQFNDEINDFYNYLKENKFTDEEIKQLLSPLFSKTNGRNLKLYIIILTIFLIAAVYLLTYIDTLAWHFAAFGRILLIKLLPYWDWTELKNEKCLIPKYKPSGITNDAVFNCDLCEAIDDIAVYDHIDEDILKLQYLDVDIPVIVKHDLMNWPNSTLFINNLISNEIIAKSKPCGLSTNIAKGIPNVKTLLTRSTMFQNFFVHFRNCDLQAVKQFRSFTPRPPTLPLEISPVQYNWLLWSNKYNTSQYKPIELIEKITLIGQVVGEYSISLIPRNNCEQKCPQINVKLKEQEYLLFTSLWNLEYKPNALGENIAVILEMH